MTKGESLQQELDSLNERLRVLNAEIKERAEERDTLDESRFAIMRQINEALREELTESRSAICTQSSKSNGND